MKDPKIAKYIKYLHINGDRSVSEEYQKCTICSRMRGETIKEAQYHDMKYHKELWENATGINLADLMSTMEGV